MEEAPPVRRRVGAPLGIAPALALVLLGGSACSLALDFGDDSAPDAGRADARPRDAGLPDGAIPPAVDATIPDASVLDASPRCTVGSSDIPDLPNRTCYFLIESGHPIEAARGACAAVGAHLATIGSQAEHDLLEPALAAAPYWIGLGDATTEGTFRWETGEAVTFTNWQPGEPNDVGMLEDCAVMYGNYDGDFAFIVGLWADRSCADNMRAICEINDLEL